MLGVRFFPAWLLCLVGVFFVGFFFLGVERFSQPFLMPPRILGSQHRGDKDGQGVRRGLGGVIMPQTAWGASPTPHPLTLHQKLPYPSETLLGETPHPNNRPVLGLGPFCDPKTSPTVLCVLLGAEQTAG